MLQRLDHIALRTNDLEGTAAWYQRVLGLQRVDYPGPEGFPVIMLAGNSNSGLALFPAREPGAKPLPDGYWLVPFHFAFTIDEQAYQQLQEHLKAQGVDFRLEDHLGSRSIFLADPNGYQVELIWYTT